MTREVEVSQVVRLASFGVSRVARVRDGPEVPGDVLARLGERLGRRLAAGRHGAPLALVAVAGLERVEPQHRGEVGPLGLVVGAHVGEPVADHALLVGRLVRLERLVGLLERREDARGAVLEGLDGALDVARHALALGVDRRDLLPQRGATPLAVPVLLGGLDGERRPLGARGLDLAGGGGEPPVGLAQRRGRLDDLRARLDYFLVVHDSS